MPITSSWYQCSVEAQLALMSDSMQFILMSWLSWHSTHFLNADQGEERAFCCCCTRSFQPLPSWESLPTTPSSLVSTWVTFFVLCGFGLISANTLSLCPPCSSPPSASHSALQTQHMPHRSTTTTSRYGTRTPSSPRPGNWHPVFGIQHGRGE